MILGVLTGVVSLVLAEKTCNVAPPKLNKPYVGPNGIEDPSGGKLANGIDNMSMLTG